MFRWLIGGLVALAVLGAGAFYWADRSSGGMASFLAWREYSDLSHGGQHATVNGVDIYYETYGQGDPLLLLHGGLASTITMHNQISAFAERKLVIAPDSREHGRSGPIEGAIHYADMADDMVALLDHLNVERADIFGWSDGGIIALDMAIRYPDRVGKFAVFGTNYHFEGLKDEDEGLGDADADDESLATIRTLYTQVAQDPDRWPVFYGKVTTMWKSEPQFTEDQLATIGSPALIIAGEHDVIKPNHLQSMQASIPNSELQIIPDTDHFAPMQAPEPVNDLLVAFFSK